MAHNNFGKIKYISTNVSSNENPRYSALYIDFQNADENGIGCEIEYSSITNNTATFYVAIGLFAPSVNKKILSCNILHNTDIGSRLGVIRTYGFISISNTCILGNKRTCQIYEDDASYGVVVSNCTIDFDSSSVSSGVTIANSNTRSFINRIQCLSTAISIISRSKVA